MLILCCYIHLISYIEILFLILYPNTMAVSPITALPRGWPDLSASRIPPGPSGRGVLVGLLLVAGAWWADFVTSRRLVGQLDRATFNDVGSWIAQRELPNQGGRVTRMPRFWR